MCITVWAGSWNVLRGPLPLPLGPPPEERKIIFRIVNFKHEKAVFNLAETGLNLHFVNVCVLQRKAEHAFAHTGLHKCTHMRKLTCTPTLTHCDMHTHMVTPVLARSLAHMLNAMLTCLLTQTHSHSPLDLPGPLHSTLKGSGACHLISSLYLSSWAAWAMNGEPLCVGTELGESPSASRWPASPPRPWMWPAGASLHTWARAVGKHCLPGRWDSGPLEAGQV